MDRLAAALQKLTLVLMVLVSPIALLSCGDDGGPTAPTPTPNTQTFTLSGAVTGSGAAAVVGATVEVIQSAVQGATAMAAEGATPGVTVLTDSSGRYQITGLSGNHNVRAVEACHREERAGASMNQNRVLDFQLEPRPAGRPTQESPADGAVFSNVSTYTLMWTSAPCADRYVVEVDCFHCCQFGAWCTDVGRQPLMATVNGTSYANNFFGAQPHRWRVRGVDRYGNLGPRTGWWEFFRTP